MRANSPLGKWRTPWVGALVLTLMISQTVSAAAWELSPAGQLQPSLSQDCTAQLSIDNPESGGSAAGSMTVSGWAVDLSTPSGSGIDAVRLYWDAPSEEGGVGLGVATIGLPRPDVDASLGLSESNAGWELPIDFSTLPAGWHVLYAYARSLCGWTYIAQDVYVEPTAAASEPAAPAPAPVVSQPVPPPVPVAAPAVVQTGQPVIRIESPASGAQAAGVLTVTGYAADCATGRPATSVKLYSGTSNPVLLGTFAPNSARDLSAVCGAGHSGAVNAGFSYQVNPNTLAAGSQTITAIAETSTGQASSSFIVNVGSSTTAGASNQYGTQTNPNQYGSNNPYGTTQPQAGTGYAGAQGYGTSAPQTATGASSSICPIGSTYAPNAIGCGTVPGGNTQQPNAYANTQNYNQPYYGNTNYNQPYFGNTNYNQPYYGNTNYNSSGQCPIGSVLTGNQCIPTASYYGSGVGNPGYGSPYGTGYVNPYNTGYNTGYNNLYNTGYNNQYNTGYLGAGYNTPYYNVGSGPYGTNQPGYYGGGYSPYGTQYGTPYGYSGYGGYAGYGSPYGYGNPYY